MKKVRAMLAIIGILAVVGGAFAFKAKNAFIATLYYTTVTTTYKVPANLTFSSATTNLTTKAIATTSYYYTVSPVATTASSSRTYVTTLVEN